MINPKTVTETKKPGKPTGECNGIKKFSVNDDRRKREQRTAGTTWRQKDGTFKTNLKKYTNENCL